MARITYPDTILGWIELFKTVKEKVLALATPNTVDAYLTANNVVLADDEIDVAKAKVAHLLAAEKERDGEKFTENGELLWNKCNDRHRKMCQNLKTVHRTQPHVLGDWGITIDNVSKIVYKIDRNEHATEMHALVTKHNSYAPGTSPLEGILAAEAIDIAQHDSDIDDAMTAFADSDTAHGQSETQNELCSNKLNRVIEHIRGMGQAAVNMYASEPHRAGDLGFTIDASKQPSKPRTFTLDADGTMSLNRVDNGSFITVDGEGEILIVPKGTQTAAKGSKGIVNKDKKFLVTRGFGSCVVKNLNTTQKVTFTAYIFP